MLIFLVLAASFLYSPWVNRGPVLCPLRFFLGMPCPSCGLTRSFCAVAQGNFAEAFAHHLFGPLLYAFMALSAVCFLWEAAFGRRIRSYHKFAFSRKFGYAMGYGMILYHADRLSVMAFSGALGESMNHSALAVIISRVVTKII